MRRQHLKGNHTIETGVGGAVHLSHPSGTERGENLVRAKANAGRQAHVRELDDYGTRTHSLGGALAQVGRTANGIDDETGE
ncbi:MAG: hypothetical protein DMF89_27255 [Acidobacteria bacterium]|nr:MAG: hypothetical protein DMF89_27255 [Acidobacteriota bacterium]